MKTVIKVELTLVAVPLPPDREAAYREGMRLLARLVRRRAARLMADPDYHKEHGDGGNG